MTLWWARWSLKSPASRLFTQRFIQSQIRENSKAPLPLQWRHNGHDSVSNHQPHDCLLNRLFRRRSNKTSKFRVTGFCVGNLPGTGQFPAQMASYAENVSIWWRHHALVLVRRIHRWPVNSPHKGPVKRKMFPFDDGFMLRISLTCIWWGEAMDVHSTSSNINKRLPALSYRGYFGIKKNIFAYSCDMINTVETSSAKWRQFVSGFNVSINGQCWLMVSYHFP